MLGIYLFEAWVAFQGIEAVADGLAMPEWVPGFAVVVLILGLPIVLATAIWVASVRRHLKQPQTIASE